MESFIFGNVAQDFVLVNLAEKWSITYYIAEVMNIDILRKLLHLVPPGSSKWHGSQLCLTVNLVDSI
jgi:hypothetical protein